MSRAPTPDYQKTAIVLIRVFLIAGVCLSLLQSIGSFLVAIAVPSRVPPPRTVLIAPLISLFFYLILLKLTPSIVAFFSQDLD